MMDESKSLGIEIRHLSSLIKLYVDRVIGKNFPSDLTGSECMVLGYIFKHSSERLSASVIIQKFKISKGTASQTLSSLQKKGYIVQKTSTADRRIKELSLSKKGKRLKNELDGMFGTINDRLERNFSPEEKKELIRLLGVMASNIEEEGTYGRDYDDADEKEVE